MTPIEALVQESQDQHRRYYDLYGTDPVSGDELRAVAGMCRVLAQETQGLRRQVIATNFSTAVLG